METENGLSALVQRNLDVVKFHIENEARDVESVLGLYTDDVVLEVPGRRLRFVGRDAIRANYEAMWSSMAEVQLQPLDRFATATRVVDDMLIRFRLVGPGMANAPLEIGSWVEIRLVHHFEMRDGLIACERVFELWRPLDAASSSELKGG
jgi:hypothetical protein